MILILVSIMLFSMIGTSVITSCGVFFLSFPMFHVANIWQRIVSLIKNTSNSMVNGYLNVDDCIDNAPPFLVFWVQCYITLCPPKHTNFTTTWHINKTTDTSTFYLLLFWTTTLFIITTINRNMKGKRLIFEFWRP